MHSRHLEDLNRPNAQVLAQAEGDAPGRAPDRFSPGCCRAAGLG